MIQRLIRSHIEARMFKGKAIVVLGPMQSRKATLSKSFIENYPIAETAIISPHELGEWIG